MTMDGMEILGSQPHVAATSPFLLSSPPLGHHHATFNLQAVQLSFDACLTYNSTTGESSDNSCINSLNLVSNVAPSTSSANSTLEPNAAGCSSVSVSNSKSTSATLPPVFPIHHQCLTLGQMEHNQCRDQNQESTRKLEIESPTPLDNSQSNIKTRRLQRPGYDASSKECAVECKNEEQNLDEKDKQGDLNTPVTTTSDLPSFFGPAALVEPPPISGNQNPFLLIEISPLINYA